MLKNNYDFTRNQVILILLTIPLTIILYQLSLMDYLLFHSLIEIFTIVIGWTIFIIMWNTRKHTQPPPFLMFFGISIAYISFIDLLHTLAYSGTGIFPAYTANLPTQLWIAARYIQSISFLIAVNLINPPKIKLSIKVTLFLYTLITSILLILIFTTLFPVCYDNGLTQFKIYSEYIIVILFILSILFLNKEKLSLDRTLFRYLLVAIIFTILSELSFTFYISVTGFSNFVGHIFRLFAFYLIYRAIIVTTLENPLTTLYRNLKQNEKQLILDKEQLTQSNIINEDLNETLKLINSILRHDLLNNFHSINLYLEYFQNEPNDELFVKTKSSITKGVNLINNMRNMESLLSSGEALKKIDISNIITEVIRTETGLKSLDISIFGCEQCYIKADEAIKSVISNLLRNIVDHSGSERVEIKIEEASDMCILEISDFGIGILDTEKAKVFGAGHSTKKSENSLGLGLFIVKGVINRYKGKINIEDNKPGTKFIIRIPRYI